MIKIIIPNEWDTPKAINLMSFFDYQAYCTGYYKPLKPPKEFRRMTMEEQEEFDILEDQYKSYIPEKRKSIIGTLARK